MPTRLDLHTHSTASDGTLAPRDLIARAFASGLSVIALTDHDTTEGVSEARRAASVLGLTLVPGVEISATWGRRTVHILGLGIDPDAPELRQGLGHLRNYRVWRAEEIGRRLAGTGVEGAFEGARALSNGRLVGRMHFARYLVQRGYAQNLRDVFKRYLVKGKPGHVSSEWSSMEEAVGWIRCAGGQAVIAHPARYGFTRSKMLRMIGEFKEQGGDGLEVVSGSQSLDETYVFARHAREQGLLASAGSDFHGPGNSYLDLGSLPPLPAGCTAIWEGWDLQRPSRAVSA